MKKKRPEEGKRGVFSILFVCFLLQILVEPIFEGSLLAGILGDMFFYCLLAAALWSMKEGRLFIPSLILFPVIVATEAIWYLYPSNALMLISGFSAGAFLLLVVIQIVADVSRQRSISADTIMGGLCGYILLGILWTCLYVSVEMIRPGSFDFRVYGSNLSLDQTFILLYYYSFSTLLTIGFGDIVPTGHMAQSLSILEGLIGQFYLVFFVAALVGLYIQGREKRA